MKKVILLWATCLFISYQSFAACRIDTVNVYSVSVDGASKAFTGRMVNTYDAKDSVLTKLEQNFTNNAWVNQRLTTQTFNAAGMMLTKITQNFNSSNSQWINIRKDENIYSNNFVTESIEWLWSTSINDWYENKRNSYTNNAQGKPITTIYKEQTVNKNKSSSTYDANQNETEKILEVWTNNAWVNNQKTTFTYDASNRLTSETPNAWNTQTNQWNPGGQQIGYSYNASGNLLERTTAQYNGGLQAWEVVQKTTNTYGAFGIIQVANQQYFGPSVGFKTLDRQIWTYNQQTNRLSEKLFQAINAQETYDNTYKEEYTFNASGLLTTLIKSDWISQTNSFRPSEREDYNYSATNKIARKLLLRLSQLGGLQPVNEWVYEYNTDDDLIAYEVKSSFNGSVFTVRNREEYICGVAQQPNGIESININAIAVSPNPASNLVVISNVKEGYVVTIMNGLGQQVKQLAATSNNVELDVTTLQSGLYFLLFNNNKASAKRLVVKH